MPTDSVYKLVIADDHPLYRAALVQMLGRAVDADKPPQILEVSGMSQVRQVLDENPDTDLLMLDLHMPGASGLTGLAKLRETCPLVPVAVISGDQRPEAVHVAMHLGAVAYLPKTLAPEELAGVIRGVLAGHHWFPETLETEGASTEKTVQFARRVARLTPQQAQIYAMVAAGMLNKQIGYELGISVPTVKSHVTAVLRTLQVRDRKQLIIMAKSLEMFEQDEFRAAPDPG